MITLATLGNRRAFVISFPWGCANFNAMKDQVKAMEGRKFDPASKAWVVPVISDTIGDVKQFAERFGDAQDQRVLTEIGDIDESTSAPEPEPVAPNQFSVKLEKELFILTWSRDHPYWDDIKNAVKSIDGRKFDKSRKCWTVPHEPLAAKGVLGALEYFAGTVDREALDVLQALHTRGHESKTMSRATHADVQVPCPEGLSYMPFQLAGIAYAMAHENVLIGDEMGLGKTIQAIGVSNASPETRNVLIICPASLRINWMREWEKWDIKNLSTGIATTKTGLPGTDVVIINYDITWKMRELLRCRNWDMVIMDEAHLLKNHKAQRTYAVLGGKREEEVIEPIPAQRRLALTGTPLVNRPAEGWTLFHALAPNAFGSWYHYMTRYAAAYRGDHGWDVSGASHLDELQDKLRTSLMIRRLKCDVLQELPAKRRQVIEIPANGAKRVVATEAKAAAAQQELLEGLQAAVELAKVSEDQDEYRDAVKALRAGNLVAFSEIASLRHQTALAKVPVVCEHVRQVLEANDAQKIILFAHHIDVIDQIMAELGPDFGAVKVTGQVNMSGRQAAVDMFQASSQCRLFVGNIKAAGVGLTLTASDHVVFAELDYVPGIVQQAEDRAHRIGQSNSVLVQHLVLEGSLDARMAKALVAKQVVLDKALDDEHTPAPQPDFSQIEPTSPPFKTAASDKGEVFGKAIGITEEDSAAISASILVARRASSSSTSRQQLEFQADLMTDAQISAVHQACQFLTDSDTDYAMDENGFGWNKVDSHIGHTLGGLGSLTPLQAALGRSIAKKYHRQYTTLLLETMG